MSDDVRARTEEEEVVHLHAWNAEFTPEMQRRAERAEANYRRGYAHGYSAAMDDALRAHKKGYTRPREVWNILARFFDEALEAWRSKPLTFIQPPNPAIEPWGKVRARIIKRDTKCVICESTHRLEVDHILPVASGGFAEDENLRTLCAFCHRKAFKHE